ncbi:MAG: hypothetical protein KJ824_00230 [Alphaproteobacteria bacterium]|nr:hypothetical protein [Alphaproteobacteria bacterium]
MVLAIMALATAIILPNGARLMDQTVAQSVFFEFQRDVLQLRREANRSGAAITLLSGGAEPADATQRTLTLREGWSYALTPALSIDEAGACAPGEAVLTRNDVPVMRLRVEGAGCRFIRYLPTAAGRR